MDHSRVTYVDYTTDCSECGHSPTAKLAVKWDETNPPGAWVRCGQCEWINWATQA